MKPVFFQPGCLPALFILFYCNTLSAQNKVPILETGATTMPDEWIDKDTRHKVVRIAGTGRRNMSFYFHNNPFVDNKMVYYSSSTRQPDNIATKQETYNSNVKGKQLYVIDLSTRKREAVTNRRSPMTGEIFGKKGKDVYYQVKDSIFSTNINTKITTLIYVFPADFKAGITSLNADETLLGGTWGTDAEKVIFKNNPTKSDYFNKIYEAKLPRTLFVIDIKKKELRKIFTDSAWLNHVQFSPTNPALLMFCHEGPWHKVDRIWSIDVNTRKVQLMHKRTMDMEIAGHEWFSPDGNTIWFDLQQPRGSTFFVAGVDVNTLKEKKYSLARNEWSIHYNISPDQKLFCGDGGNPAQVAKAPDGQWIYLFTPEGDRFISEKLVNMKNHNYKLEPNVHFSPDGKWIIFRANFEGTENIYAAEIKKTN